MKKYILRKPSDWPDLYEGNNWFYKKGSNHSLAFGVIILILIICAVMIGVQIGRMIEIRNKTVEAQTFVLPFDNSMSERVYKIDFNIIKVTMPVYPDTPAIWMPDLPELLGIKK